MCQMPKPLKTYACVLLIKVEPVSPEVSNNFGWLTFKED